MFSLTYTVTVLGLLLVGVFVKETFGAQAILQHVPKPAEFADQEGCYDPTYNRVLPSQEPFYPETCSKRVCQENDGDILIMTCGAIDVGPGACLVKGDMSLPYPDCCDSIGKCETPTNPLEHLIVN